MEKEFYPFTMLDYRGHGLDFKWPDSIPTPNQPIIQHNGPFAMISKIRALTCTVHTKDIGISYPIKTAITVWGYRNLESPTAQGYEMIGRVKLNGKRYRAFTSDMLIEFSTGLKTIGYLYASENGEDK